MKWITVRRSDRSSDEKPRANQKKKKRISTQDSQITCDVRELKQNREERVCLCVLAGRGGGRIMD